MASIAVTDNAKIIQLLKLNCNVLMVFIRYVLSVNAI